MRVALLGVGRMGRLHARLLAELTDPAALVVADLDASRAREVAAELRATAVADMAEAIRAADALVIATVTSAHAELIRAGLERGVPIFCEKPLSPELSESARLVAEIEAAGLPFQLGFHRRFDVAYRAARQLIETGAMGRVYLLRLAGHDAQPPHESYIPASGGFFHDSSIHDFDIARWLTGQEVEEVYADGAVRAFEAFGRYGDVDTAVATLRLSDGTLGVLTGARHNGRGYDVRMEIFGSLDSVSIGLAPRTPLRSLEPGVPPPSEPAWSIFLDRFADAYRAELAAFLRVAGGEEASACTARDGLEAQRVAAAAGRSLREHRPVRPSEIDA